jgi:Protein of unknown function (DUF1566)
VKGTICLACAFAVVLATWTTGRAEAASRCVPNNRFVVLPGGLVSDTLTKLVWQQQASSTTMSWPMAKISCPSGFRLPTVKELVSIVDLTVTAPTIDQTAFPGTPVDAFWASSPYAGSSGGGWYVHFLFGLSNSGGVGSVGYARCVR